jgi:carbon monoxide dehydrogenase subunit G
MGHLKDSIRINAPIDKVLEFTHDPHNWATYMVGMDGPNKIVGEGQVGTEYQLTVLMAGLHMRETARLAEDSRDAEGGAHARFDFEGTSSGWMAWDFKPEDGTTLVAVEEEYTVPGSVLGRVADRLIVERMEERDMHHTLENLKLLLEEPDA